jgi:oligopeptidase B
MIVWQLENTLQNIRIFNFADLTKFHLIEIPNKIPYSLSPYGKYGDSPLLFTDFLEHKYEFSYSTMVDPFIVYQYNLNLSKLSIIQSEIFPNYNSSLYETKRLYATARDGEKVPGIYLYHYLFYFNIFLKSYNRI